MRTKLRSKATLFFVAFAALLLAVAGTTMALTADPSGNTAPAPTIQSDKADYAPGETVTLTGSNWQPGESVNINVNDDEGQTWNRNVNVTADANGQVQDQFQLPTSFVATYNVTATGAQSGVATTSFTDGNIGVTSGPAPNTPQVLFNLKYTQHNRATNQSPSDGNCSTTAADDAQATQVVGSTTNGSGKNNFTQGVPSSSSIRLEAAATANQLSGWTFKNWTSPQAGTFVVLDPNNPRVVCATGNFTGGRDLVAVYQQNADTTTTVTSNNNPSTYGDSVTFTSTVTASMNGVNNPSGVGTVTFKDGATNLCGNVNLVGNTATCTTSALSVGSHNNITAVYSGGTNYNTSTSSALTQTVNKANLTVNTDNKSKVYGDANPALTGNIVGIKNSDNITASYSTTATQSSNAGTYPITATLSDPGNKLSNYNVTNTGGTLTITKAALTVKADDKSREYGDANPTFSHTVVSGSFKNNDLANGDVNVSFNTPATPASDVGNYPTFPSLGGAKAGNYNFIPLPGNLTITKAALTVEADDKSREYGDANPTFTGTLTGVKNNDDISASYSTTATAASDVGDYDIVADLSDPGNKLSNYTVTNTGGTLTITKATLTVKADDATKILGAANPTFTATYSGFKNGQVLATSGVTGAPSLTTTATAASPIGPYPITAAVGTLASTNYSFTFQPGTLKIIYNFSVASGAGFLQPINYTSHQLSTGPDVSTFKAGSTVPVKFVLKDANGNVVQAASPPQWLTPAKGGATSQPVDEALYGDPATTGTAYLSMGTHYQYNWASPKNGSGFFWRIGVRLDDGQVYYVNISLR